MANIEDFLDQIDELLDHAFGLPGGRCVVDSEKMRVVVDDIRLNIPAEIKQARGVMSERSDIVSSAKKEAENILRAAEERARVLISQEEVTKLAQQKAGEIVAQAQQKGREMRGAAQSFVDDIMRRSDENLTLSLSEVRKARASLRQQMPTSQHPRQQSRPPEEGGGE